MSSAGASSPSPSPERRAAAMEAAWQEVTATRPGASWPNSNARRVWVKANAHRLRAAFLRHLEAAS